MSFGTFSHKLSSRQTEKSQKILVQQRIKQIVDINEMEPAFDDVQDNVDSLGKIYTNLTSILLVYGYEHILENMDKSEDIECIDETLKLLSMLESDMAQEQANEPAQATTSRKTTHPKHWNYMTRLATSHADMKADQRPLISFKPVPDTLLQYYAKAAAKLDAQLARQFPNAPKNQQLHVMDMRKRLLNRNLKNALQTSLENKIKENLSQKPMPTKAQRPENQQLNQSINIEDLHIEI